MFGSSPTFNPKPFSQKGHRVRRIYLAPALVMAGLFLAGSLFAQAPGTMDLSGPWKVSRGDNANWSKVDFDDMFWKEVTLPGTWQAPEEPPYKGFAWFRKHVQVPESWGSDPVVKGQKVLKLDIGQISDAAEVYWNGTLVGISGKFPPQFEASTGGTYVGVPSDKTSFGKDNVLALRVFNQAGPGGVPAGPLVLRTPAYADYLDLQIDGKDKRLEFTGAEGLPFDIYVLNTSLAPWNAGTLKVAVIDEAGKVLVSQPVTVDVAPEKQFHLTQKLDDLNPGLYTIRADLVMNGETLKSVARTFAYNPKAILTETFRTEEKAKAFYPKFETFWTGTLASLKSIPLNPTTTLSDKHSTDKVKVYKVKYGALGGRKIYGWLAMPASGGPFPGVVIYPGFGNGTIDPPVFLAEGGYAVLAINVHGYDVDAQYYPTLADTYGRTGFRTPEEFIFRDIMAASLRAVDYMLSNSSVRSDRIGVMGESQGGGIAVNVAALDPRVKVVVAASPAADFPRMIATGRDNPVTPIIGALSLEDRADLMATMAYFDPVILADKVRVPVMLTVGMRDTVTPPATAFALRNGFETGLAVSMVNAENGGHGSTPEQAVASISWLKKFLQD